MASSRSGSSLWAGAWLGAVARPAWRRAGAVWASLAVLAAVVMGPTALTPPTVVVLLRGSPLVSGLLAALWLALLHPVARILMRAEAASFLRTLPAPRGAPALPWLTLALMHAPVPALLAAGGLRQGALLAWIALICASALLGAVRWPQRPRPPARFASSGAGLRQILRRRLLADDALLRALGFTGLAGLGAALLIGNNQLLGASASTLGLGVVVVLGTPAWAAVIQPLAVVHRRLWPLCASSGVPHVAYVGALAAVLAGALIFLCVLAAALAALASQLPPGDALRMLAGAAVLGLALGAAGVTVAHWATQSALIAERVMTGALVCTAAAALLLGTLAEAGLAAALALAGAALLRLREPVLC